MIVSGSDRTSRVILCALCRVDVGEVTFGLLIVV